MFGNTKIDQAALSAGPEMIDLIEGFSQWAVSLQGRTPLRTGLARLRDAFGAEAVVLSRVGQGGSARALAADSQGGTGRDSRIEESFANALLGRYVLRPRPGSLWFSDQLSIDDCPKLRSLQRHRKLSELVVLVLEVEAKAVTFLEIHFQHRLGPEGRGTLNALATTLLTMWGQRATGSFSDALLTGPAKAEGQPSVKEGTQILSTGNPAQLSRAEFRICTLLSTGLSASRTRQELNISDSTLRSHLRQIYLKTDCANMAELLYKLLANRPTLQEALQPLRIPA